MTASAMRMALRKREAPTPTLVSRFAKRQRSTSGTATTTTPTTITATTREAGEVSDDGRETESDFESPRPAKAVVARPRRPRSPTTDRGLTFLQNAQRENHPVRSGKWNDDEEHYLRKLVQLFTSGVLDDVEPKMSMRMWLAKMLNCCPMRISKKQTNGEKFKGKAKYGRNVDRIERMTQKEFDKSWQELHVLRGNFLKNWAKEEFSRWGCDGESRNFDNWYNAVVRNVPNPKLAKNKRLVEPRENTQIEPWMTVWKNLDSIAKHEPKIGRPRDSGTKKRTLQPATAAPKPTDVNEQVTQSQSLLQAEQSLACLEVCCVPAPLDMSQPVCEVFFDPVPSPEMELEIDLSAVIQQWEIDAATPTKPTIAFLSEQPIAPQPSPGIVLDFGPPSLWNVDPITKNKNASTRCSEWVDDLLDGDDSLLTFDPAQLSTCDLSSEQWFQQLCTTFQL